MYTVVGSHRRLAQQNVVNQPARERSATRRRAECNLCITDKCQFMCY